MVNLWNLSHIDFEELCIDIIQKETGEKFSSFGSGADGGIDGRHSKGDNLTVLQCKHYLKSSAYDLLRSAKKEVIKLDKLKPDRYAFFTSYSLTPSLSNQLAEIFGSYVQTTDDIWGAEDIKSALRRHQDILKSHIKLWLTDSVILERILHSGLESFTQITKDEIIEESKVYVRNPSYDDAFSILDSKNTLVISGPPGIGKTTLAKMVCYQYLKDGWNFYAINSLEQGYAKVNENKKTIFFFDDFLGKIELNRKALISNESALATFVKRIQKSESSKFILTTRSHIFEEARRLSENIDNQRFQLSKYILDVGLYTRKIRAHILFNHISTSQISREHVVELLDGDWLKRIIDHKNYNPRVISQISSENLEPIQPKDYPNSILLALDNPNSIWEKAFSTLGFHCQHLLITLFFCKEYLGTEIEDLRMQYGPLHSSLAHRYSQARKPTDFDEALKILESGFISIKNKTVDFVNPSVRDFLKGHLKDNELLLLIISNSMRVNFAIKVSEHIKSLKQYNESSQAESAKSFESLIPLILSSPTKKLVQMDSYQVYRHFDSSISDRVKLLLDVYDITRLKVFEDAIKVLLTSDKLDVDTSSDSSSLPEIYSEILTIDSLSNRQRTELLDLIVNKIESILVSGIHIEDLAYAIEYVYEFIEEPSLSKLKNIIKDIVSSEINDIEQGDLSFDDVDEVELYIENFKKITEKTEYCTKDIINTLGSLAVDLEESEYEHTRVSHKSSTQVVKENFTDTDLKSLFYNLIG